jgi:uncharacterized repeat protein (TIGR01451 family)
MTIDNLGRIVMVGDSHAPPEGLAVARYLSSSADLSITESASPNPVLAGGTLTYTIVVTNNGPDATLAELTDQLPPSVNFLSASTTQGTCSQANGTVTCALGNLAVLSYGDHNDSGPIDGQCGRPDQQYRHRFGQRP